MFQNKLCLSGRPRRAGQALGSSRVIVLGSPRGSSTGELLPGGTGPCLGRRRREAADPLPVAP